MNLLSLVTPIGQCLSNKNESATVAKNENFCELNKASVAKHIYTLLLHAST